MTLYRNKYRIETTRLKGRDYANDGYYFITICVKNKKQLFGRIKNGKMILYKKGEIVKETWENLPEHYKNIRLHEFVVMPDHIHGIIEIQNKNIETSFKGVLKSAEACSKSSQKTVETGLKPVSTNNKRYSLSEVVRGFKTFSARKINQIYKTQGRIIWQDRFYDRIIRNEFELFFITEYIKNNPLKEYLGYDDYLMIKDMENQKSVETPFRGVLKTAEGCLKSPQKT